MRSRLDLRDHLTGDVAIAPREPYRVADTDVLPFRVDGVGVADVCAHDPLQPGIAVEATAILTDLRQPRPHHRGGRIDAERTGGSRCAVDDQLVAGQDASDLVVVGAPREDPLPQPAPTHRGHGAHSRQVRQPCPLSAHMRRLGTAPDTVEGPKVITVGRVRPRATPAPPQACWTRLRVRRRRVSPSCPHQVVIDDDATATGQRAHGELLVVGRAQFAHEDVEWNTKGRSHFHTRPELLRAPTQERSRSGALDRRLADQRGRDRPLGDRETHALVHLWSQGSS